MRSLILVMEVMIVIVGGSDVMVIVVERGGRIV